MSDPILNMAHGAAPADAGYDCHWYQWSPLPARPPVFWPDGARTAVCVVVHLGAVEWETEWATRPQAVGGRGIAPAPDFPRMSNREFGHRVGVFRLLAILEELAIPAAAVVDVATAEHYPALMSRLLPFASEIIAGGLSASRPVTSRMSEDEERDYIAQTLHRLEVVVGSRPEGWIGPEHSESQRTPRLLDQAGVGYVADWANDELPYPMTGAGDRLWAFPLCWELSDLSAMFVRLVPPTVWSRSVRIAFDVMHAEGRRLLALHLQPWVSGQAFRAPAVEAALRHIRDSGDVWFASPGQVVRHSRVSGA